MIPYSKENKTEYNRQYFHEVRKKAVFDYLGGKCVWCGKTDELHIDHINPDEKEYEISKRLSLKNNKEELDKCQLLCKFCHQAKTAIENSGYTHGSMYAWQKQKCTCAPCSQAKRVWYDLRNERRRAVGGKSRGQYNMSAPVCGMMKMYERGCRCLDCKAANTEYKREQRNRLRKSQ